MPRCRSPGSQVGLPASVTLAGPPERMMAAGRPAARSAGEIVCGTISEYTPHSRTRRAISCVYWDPKSRMATYSFGLGPRRLAIE